MSALYPGLTPAAVDDMTPREWEAYVDYYNETAREAQRGRK